MGTGKEGLLEVICEQKVLRLGTLRTGIWDSLHSMDRMPGFLSRLCSQAQLFGKAMISNIHLTSMGDAQTEF